MIKSIGGSNEELSIVSGFERTLYDAFKNSLERGQAKAWLQVLHFIQKQMILAFGNNSLPVMQQLNWLPAALYNVSSANSEVSKTIAKEFATFFQSISWLFQSDDDTKDPIGEHPVRFQIYFNTLMNFYHYALHHPDETVVREIIKQFGEIGDNDYDFDTRHELQIAGNISQDEKREIREQANKKHLLMITKRRATLTLVAWFTFLYTMEKVGEERLKFLIKQFNLQYHFFEELLDDIDYIRSNESANYLGIDFWDYMERESGVMYSPPSAYDWILYGPVLLLLRDQIPNFNESFIIDHREHAFLLSAIQTKLQVLKVRLNKITGVLGWDTIDSREDANDIEQSILQRFNEREEQIISLFEFVKIINEEEENRQLIARALDWDTINRFYEKLYEKWFANCLSYGLFRTNGVIKTASNPENLDYHGQSILLERQRVMFTQGKQQRIYGSEDLGSAIARTVDDDFVNRIIKLAEQLKTEENMDFPSVTSGLDACIVAIRKNGFEPDIIILSSQPFYKSDLVSSKKYQRINIQEGNPQIGIYDNIPVIRLFTKGLNYKGIVSSFKQGFSLTLWENESLYHDILKLNLRELTNEEIEMEYKTDIDRWSKNSDGIKLTETQAKLRLAASLTLEMWARGKFEIADQKGVKWFAFTPDAMS
jgi:hypothetical protein